MAKRTPMIWALALSVSLGAPLAAAPAHAATPVSELKDVTPDHWAYNALKTLVDKYKVMEGYPDLTFRGNKTLNRYEFAAALAKVMARVEQRIAQATGQAVEVDPGVNPEDLRTLARLQREFREELDALKSRVDTMDARLMALEKRVKISGMSQVDSRDYTAGAAAGQSSADFRVRNSLMLDAELVEDLAFTGKLNVDLYSPQTAANGFERGPSTGSLTDVYLPKALLVYTPNWSTMNLGVGAIREGLTLGSTLADPFKTNLWRNALGGYGFVGTPGLNAGATGMMAANGAGAVAWLPGTNVMVDVFDPNNSRRDLPTGDLLGTAEGRLGPVRLGLGVARGGLSGGVALAGMAPNVAGSIPAFMPWAMGDRLFGTVGLDFGMVRLNGALTSPSTTLGGGGFQDKTAGLALDVGSEALNFTAEVLGNASALTFGDFRGTKGSVRLSSLNLFDSGFGLGLGAVTGNVGTTGSLLAGQAEYTSYGAMLKTPSFFILPSLTLAAQNTTSGLFGGGAIGSGLTIGGDLNLWGLPTLSAEYSLAKFGAGANNALWGSGAFDTHQLAVSTMVKF